jgi:hypothetical protein
MNTLKFAAALALIGPIVVSPAMATTYAVNDTDGLYSVAGSITTDGKLGVLATSDILDWTLDISSQITLTPANSGVTLTGDHLTATPTALYFDYTDAFPALYELIFAGSVDDTNGSVTADGSVSYTTQGQFTLVVCDTGILCFPHLGDFRGDVGLIAGTTATATPLPAALPLFATGLGAFGLLGWRRKRKVAA